MPELAPRLFSFNSPHGACPNCTGLGTLLKIDLNKLIAPALSVFEGAIIPLATQMSVGTWIRPKIETLFQLEKIDPKLSWKELPESFQLKLLYGSVIWEGFVTHLERRYRETDSDFIRSEISKYMNEEVCPTCQGSRLKPEALSVTFNNLNIYELTTLSIKDCLTITKNDSQLNSKELAIAKLILKEINTRLEFLLSVGLDYLTLSRQAGTLAGGEAQRIRLASQIGSGLTGVLYVLDEPSIGLHQRDNQKLIATLKNSAIWATLLL